MKKINVTFSIPNDTHKALHSLVGQRKMSAFVTKVLDEALKHERESLRLAYIEAEKDPDRKSTIDDWKDIDRDDWE